MEKRLVSREVETIFLHITFINFWLQRAKVELGDSSKYPSRSLPTEL
jgi:hypothetical protein